MRERKNKKKWLLYPEDPYKTYWDLFITIILLISCLTTPFRIAFGEDIEDPIEWLFINNTIDILFLVDIFVNFFSAYYDNEFIIVEDRKQIARDYLTGWFTIDILAIIPFEIFGGGSDGSAGSPGSQRMARIVRLGRIYRIIKMTKLLRIMKIIKEKSKIMKYLNEILKVGLGFERLVFFVILFFIMNHVIACVWVLLAKMTAEFTVETHPDGSTHI